MKKIMVVEDEYAIRDLISVNLGLAGYEVLTADSAEHAIELFNRDPQGIDVALLDIMLPGIDGFKLCEHMRRVNTRMGIIFISARTQEFDKVKGLGIGADDYITKPFGTNELLARVEAVYRRINRVSSESPNQIASGEFVLDLSGRRLTKGGVPVELTQVEFQIMELFMENAGAALSRERILAAVWGENYFGELKIVDVNIRRLRIKIEDDPGSPQHIVTVWGFGYRWTA